MVAVASGDTEPGAPSSRYERWLGVRGQYELAGGTFLALVAAGTLRGHAPDMVVIGWIAVALAVAAVRFSILRGTGDGGTRLKLLFAGIGVGGAIWGALGVIAAGALPSANAAGALCAVAIVAAFCVAAYSADFVPTLAAVLPALLPGAARLLGIEAPGAHTAAVALLGLAALTCIAATLVRGFVSEALELGVAFESTEMQLRNYRGEVEKLQVAAKSSAEQRAEAERELRRVSADLGLLKSKTHVLSQTLERVSPLCPVTRLPNRRSFDNALMREWDRALRDRKSLSLAICDVDFFKEYQETYGNQSADVLLQKVADQLRKVGKRGPDLAARYSEGQFALLWPGTDTRNALRMTEDARQRVEQAAIPLDLPDHQPYATIRAGVATVVPSGDLEPKEILDRVDSALQQAAVGGANTVAQHRALYSYRLDRWNPQADGQFSEQSFIRKILHWGFEGRRVSYHPGVNLPDTAVDHEILKGVTSGELIVILDGQRITLRQGDCVFIPSGTTMSVAVSGNSPVTGIDGRRRA
ncbi:MAG: diguanylate cyclase [Gammaproteobacteria bacterium]